MDINLTSIETYFLLFFIYAFLGWTMEVTCKLIQYKRFINRGFLIGPYCPIYGYGSILITLLLNKFVSNPILLFFMAILICGTLEYLTSFFMEKLFHARWWDYSQKKFNINGRVCLDTIIPFGLLGLTIMYVLNPLFFKGISLLNHSSLNITSAILFTIFFIDNIISFFVIKYINQAGKIANEELDNTEEITKKVKELLSEKSILHRRLINAYPRLRAMRIVIKKKAREIKRKQEEITNDLKDKTIELKDNIIEKSGDIKDTIVEKSSDIKDSIIEKSGDIKDTIVDFKDNLFDKNDDKNE